MEPTLDVNQRILGNRFIYHFTDPKPGDVVVFHPPAGVDHKGYSDDSRFWGPLLEDWLIGKPFATYWPPNRIGDL